MQWYVGLIIGIIALIVGYLIGQWRTRQATDAVLSEVTTALDSEKERADSLHASKRELETQVSTLTQDRDSLRSSGGQTSRDLDALNEAHTKLKQTAAEEVTARKAADAELASAKEAAAKATDAATAAKAEATDASEKFETITADFVALKRSQREAEDALIKAEAAMDQAVAEAEAATSQAAASVDSAERAAAEEIAKARLDRDSAVAETEELRKKRVDADALRRELMTAQAELAEMREMHRAVSPVTDDATATDDTAPVVDAPPEDDDDVVTLASDGTDEEIQTVEDLPGAGWEPGQPIVVDESDAANETASEGGEDESDAQPAAGEAEAEPVVVPDDADSADSGLVEPEPAPEPADDDSDQAVVNAASGASEMAASDGVETDEPLAAPAEMPTEDRDTADTPDEASNAGAEPDVAVGTEPESVTSVPDDLRKIKGIGPKFERLLHARDVTTYAQIAELTDDEEWETYLETFAGRIEREDWRSQATQLMGGEA